MRFPRILFIRSRQKTKLMTVVSKKQIIRCALYNSYLLHQNRRCWWSHCVLQSLSEAARNGILLSGKIKASLYYNGTKLQPLWDQAFSNKHFSYWKLNPNLVIRSLVNCERDDFNPIMIKTRTLKYYTNQEKIKIWQGLAWKRPSASCQWPIHEQSVASLLMVM